jgi:hypothetical protein
MGLNDKLPITDTRNQNHLLKVALMSYFKHVMMDF